MNMLAPTLLLKVCLLFCLLLQSLSAFSPSYAFGGVVFTGRASSTDCSFHRILQQQPSTPSSLSRTVVGGQLFGKKEARAEGNARKGASERVRKVKDDVIEITGVVIDSLPNAMFRVTIDGAPATQEPIMATISGKIRKNFVKILVGDKVKVELSPYDLTRGRITFRSKAFPPT